MSEKSILRARDFWAAIVLFALSIFFLLRTSDIPFLGTGDAGVRLGGWYNSAALVPYCLFSALLLLSLVLMYIAVRDGGAKHAFSAIGLGLNASELSRVSSLSIIIFFYIFALVPRVDFTIASALMFCVLVLGFHRGNAMRMLIAVVLIGLAGCYALIVHYPQSEWSKPHDDDVVALFSWVVACCCIVAFELKQEIPKLRRSLSLLVLSMLLPLFLVCAMAFGFRQNVPNRGGMLFSKVEYVYYVTVVPMWRQ